MSEQQQPQPRRGAANSQVSEPGADAPQAAAARDRDSHTEQRILEAARRVFVRRGTSGARMHEIAAEAGVNQALLHYYFHTKEGLAEAIFLEAASRLVPAMLRLMEPGASIEQRVEEFVHFYIDEVRRTPFLPGYVLAELHQHPERLALLTPGPGHPPGALTGPLLAQLDAQLSEHAAAGTLRPISAQQFLINLLSLLVFPFAARPLLSELFGMDDEAFDRFLDERRAELPGFLLTALRP